MKKSTIKFFALALLAINIALLGGEIRNVKIILDEQAPLGIELDFSEAKLTLKQSEETAVHTDEVAMP